MAADWCVDNVSESNYIDAIMRRLSVRAFLGSALRLLLFLSLFLFWLPRDAYASDKNLAVLEFKGPDFKPEILDTLSDAVRGGASEAVKGTGINIMTRESMLVLLRDMGRRECSEGDCEVDTARNIGADYVISGQIVRMDGSFIATLKLHETKRGTLLGTKDAEAEKEKELWRALKVEGRNLVSENLGARPAPPPLAQPTPSPPAPAASAPETRNPSGHHPGRKLVERIRRRLHE